MKGALRSAYTLKWADYTLDLEKRTHIIGVINVTPDSFSDGGLFFDRDRAIGHGIEMARDGADIIDVGGESTRPYSRRTTTSEELDRVIPVIQALSKEIEIPISIDTYRSEVAEKALETGASIVNDISALRADPRMIAVASNAGVPVILMHMKGSPEDMQKNPTYKNLISEIKSFLEDAIKRAVKGGINEDLIIVDPGIGFGKSFDHNLQIIRDLDQFRSLHRPVLLAPSRKSFLGAILDKEARERDVGTLGAVVAGVMNGAHIIRVHNVKKALDAVKVADAIMRGSVNRNSSAL